jgi:outer membrane protein
MRRFLPFLLAAVVAALAIAGARAQDLATTTVTMTAQPTMTLEDAIQFALQRNKNLKVSSYLPGIARGNLLAAYGAFDPALNAQRFYYSQEFNTVNGPIPVYDVTKEDTYQVGVQGLLPIGTTYSIFGSADEVREVFNGYAKNWENFGGVQITQPLLKGFGFDANLEQVRIQKANRAISDQNYRQSAINTVTNTILAYSGLQFAHDELASAERSRALANRQVTEAEQKYKIGYNAQSDVLELRAYAALYDDSIIAFQRAVRDAQNSLRELIGEDKFFEDEPLFILAPMVLPDVSVDRRADLQTAYANRPDYEIQHLVIVQDKAIEKAARNGLLPQVNFQGEYGYNGSSMSFYQSRQMVEDHMNPSISAGLVVTIPFTFAQGRGNYRAAKLTRIQQEEQLRVNEADIAVAVATAIGQVEASRKRVDADQKAYDLFKQAVEAEEKKNKAGTGSTQSVEQQLTLESEAELTLAGAQASERQAIASYDQTLGTTLDRYHLKLSKD